MESPRIFIIVLNWNGWHDTLRCLDSLRKLRSMNYELCILVVDNGSTDDSREKIQQYLEDNKLFTLHFSLITHQENFGFGGGMNTGIRHALEGGADYVCLLNNDTIVAPDFLERLIEAGEKYKDVGMINPKILLLDSETRHSSLVTPHSRFWWIGGKINWLRTKGWHPHYGEEDKGQFDGRDFLETDYCTGCCVLVKRAVIEKIGLLPEAYFLYYEDTEWSLKAKSAGFRCVVVPRAVIWHKGSASVKAGSPLYIRYHVRNGLMLARRTGNIAQIAVAYLWSIPRVKWQLVKWLFFPAKRTWAKTILLGIWDAWRGQCGQITKIKSQIPASPAGGSNLKTV